MGFENRKSLRVNLSSQIYFWAGGEAHGPGVWGQTLNLSATGLAFRSSQEVPLDEKILIELSLPDQRDLLRVSAQVVHCVRAASVEQPFQLQVTFSDLDHDVLQQLRLYVLQVAEPGTGWGRAYFPGRPAIDTKYKEMAGEDRKEWMEKKAFLSMKEIGYLKKYQAYLEEALGSQTPESFKLVGSRSLKEQSDVWMELDRPEGQLHFLGKTLWCTKADGEKPECGIGLVAFHKDEAMRLEKGARL